MFYSSPAPFWVYDPETEYAPTGWLGELSPSKTGGLQSSSPPHMGTNVNESPTRVRGQMLLGVVGRERAEVEDEEGGIDLAK